MKLNAASDQGAAREYPSTTREARAIREQMERILASPHFRQSKRYPVLLRYVVEQTLDGHASVLKERTLGVEVFARRADYDTNVDPVVRVTAGEVRKRIAQYYHDFGQPHEPRIDLPAGSYVPQFRLPVEAKHEEPPASEEVSITPAEVPQPRIELPVSPTRPSRRRLSFIAAGALVAGLLVCLGSLYWFARERTILEAIWDPFFTSAPMLISIGEPSLGFDHDADPKLDALTVREHLHTVDRLVFSDVEALTRVTGLMDGHRRPYRLLPASSTTYADLRQGPALLLGGFDNPWTMRVTSTLRFRLMRHKGNDQLWIEDRKDPSSRQWSVNFGQRYEALVEDYAIVARVMDPNTHQPVLILAGIGENGTKAASELLTDASPEALRLLTKTGFLGISADEWKGKNFEAVVSTRVINGVSGPPTILAVEVW